jgi:hypothetical protein
VRSPFGLRQYPSDTFALTISAGAEAWIRRHGGALYVYEVNEGRSDWSRLDASTRPPHGRRFSEVGGPKGLAVLVTAEVFATGRLHVGRRYLIRPGVVAMHAQSIGGEG